MRILNDEEILELDFTYERPFPYTSGDIDRHYRQVVAKAQHQQDLKDFIEWGKETCPHDLFGEGTQCYKHACDMCWESLKQLVEE